MCVRMYHYAEQQYCNSILIMHNKNVLLLFVCHKVTSELNVKLPWLMAWWWCCHGDGRSDCLLHTHDQIATCLGHIVSKVDDDCCLVGQVASVSRYGTLFLQLTNSSHHLSQGASYLWWRPLEVGGGWGEKGECNMWLGT